MLENVAKITRVVLACGTVDMRKGIDGLSMIIGDKYKQNLFEKGTSSALHAYSAKTEHSLRMSGALFR